MYYNYSKLKAVVLAFGLGVFVMACNNNSSDTISDTTTIGTYSSPDVVPGTSADTTAHLTPMVNANTEKKPLMTDAVDKTDENAAKKNKATVTVVPVSSGTAVKKDKDGVYDVAEVNPKYPGGESAIEDYITNNIQYPEDAIDYGKEGRLGVSFVVDESGKVTEAHTVGAKLGDGLDEEAVRVVSAMPDWYPGEVHGKPVKTRVTLPIVFDIDE